MFKPPPPVLAAALMVALAPVTAYAVDCANDSAYPLDRTGPSAATGVTDNCQRTQSVPPFGPFDTLTCDLGPTAASVTSTVDVKTLYYSGATGTGIHVFGIDADGDTFCTQHALDTGAPDWFITLLGTNITGPGDTFEFEHNSYDLRSHDETVTLVDLTVNADDGDDTITRMSNNYGHVSTVNAGAGDDTVDGSPNGDTLNGGPGGDTIDGKGGADSILGGDNVDTLTGGDGDDVIEGGIGDDTITGGDGDDELRGDDDNDIINGNAGNDLIDGGPGRDILDGDDGDDEMCGGDNSSADDIDGGLDSDIIWGGDGSTSNPNAVIDGDDPGGPYATGNDICDATTTTPPTNCESVTINIPPGFCL